ncbi:MAG: PilN domain-containing protein [Pseudomonadota bacterium]
MLSFIDRVRYSPATKEIQSIYHWWVGELRGLAADIKGYLPQKANDSFEAVYEAKASDGSGYVGHVSDASDDWSELKGLVLNDDGRAKTLSILIPDQLCLVRTSSYPKLPSTELDSVIGLELATTTPFSSANAAWTWRHRDDGKTDVILIKRELIEQIRSLADEAGLILKDIRPKIADTNAPPFATFETPGTRRAQFWCKVNIGLSASLAALAVFIYFADYFQKTAALETLRSKIASTTTEARDLRAALNQKEKEKNAALKLQSLKNDRTSIVESWARITQLLPASAWVSELMLNKEGGAIVGFTGNAASLIELLEKDAALKDVTFATSIRIDPLNKAERFDIRFSHEAALELPSLQETSQ